MNGWQTLNMVGGCRLRHKHFLGAAAQQAAGQDRRRAVKLAMRFVQVPPNTCGRSRSK